jgi:ABC-2 type transport system permease protein
MPGWLGTVAEWNPISATFTATGELFGNPGTDATGWIAENAILMAVVRRVLITVATRPLAVRDVQRLSR